MDLSRVELIKSASLENLMDTSFIENLMLKLGFNTEILNEQPSCVINNGGGLLIWQYPNQFSKYLQLLRTLNIGSYIEIGCRWGGTFVLTCEYLSRFNPITTATAVDLIDSPVKAYTDLDSKKEFIRADSTSSSFKSFMSDRKYDLIFIDGDHSYNGVKNDFLNTVNSGKHFVFHDIDNAACPGVVQFWNELKSTHANKFIFYEFKDQYDEVISKTGNHYLGIGVAVAKDDTTSPIA